jgi:hypothetical protein
MTKRDSITNTDSPTKTDSTTKTDTTTKPPFITPKTNLDRLRDLHIDEIDAK